MILLFIFILQFPLLFIATKIYKRVDEKEKLDGEDIKFLAWGILPFFGFIFSIALIITAPIYILCEKELAQKIADLINGDKK